LGDSIRVYAKHSGVTPNAVCKWKVDGKLVLEPDGTINRDASDETRRARTDPSRAGGRGLRNGAVRDAYHAARAAREGYQARILELEYKRLAGELVPLAEVKLAAFNSHRIVRDQLLSLPDRLAPILISVKDVAEMHRILYAELVQVCESLVTTFRSRANGDRG